MTKRLYIFSRDTIKNIFNLQLVKSLDADSLDLRVTVFSNKRQLWVYRNPGLLLRKFPQPRFMKCLLHMFSLLCRSDRGTSMVDLSALDLPGGSEGVGTLGSQWEDLVGELASRSLITHVVGRCHFCQPLGGRTRFLADLGRRGKVHSLAQGCTVFKASSCT